MIRLLALLLFSLSCQASDTYLGYDGHWLIVVATGYSPFDQIDSTYRKAKGKDLFMTAGRVSDVRVTPYGIAAPQHGTLVLPLRTKVIVPAGCGFPASDQVVLVDDTGSIITRRTESTGILHIDLRFKTEYSARKYGVRTIRIFVVDE